MKRLPIAALFVFVAACSAPESAGPTDVFPEHFRWGTAIAGFQVDMGCPTLPPERCEDRNSDWYAWITDPTIAADETSHLSGDPPTAAPGHWELYAEDYRLAKEVLHNNALRFSIEWSRIFPTSTVGVEGFDALKKIADADAIAHYHAELAELKKQGLRPLVTLNHYTLPLWIHDPVACHQDLDTCPRKGWVDRDGTVTEIAKYAGFVAQEFGGEVDTWATLNEPMAVVLPGYIFPSADRTNPPGVSFHSDAARTVMLAMIEAHARMYDAVHAHDTIDTDGDGKAAEVGVVYAMVPVRPKNPDNALDRSAAKNIFYLYNSAFLNAVIKGDVDELLDRRTIVHRDDLAGRMDYLGINYYTRVTVQGTETASLPDLSPLTNFNPLDVSPWENYPRGIYEMALVARDYGVPCIITENGTADGDTPNGGLDYLVPHLIWLQRAIRDGADVRGYFYWTLMDNFEWNHGMDVRMGMFSVNKDDPEKKRTSRRLAEAYGRIARENRVPDDLQQAWPAPEE
ncbi:MAG: glycoside hydrolase family 1 protein [Myxococcaceae bacterium]|nr:glycoside hydrolase family 1 protein [Myxococcaceae bacterium]